MNITTGKKSSPVRAVVYGPEGVGKSTFAAAWPAPVFIDVEGGTKQLDVSRIEPMESGDDIRRAIASLTNEAHNFQTVVIDTADWMEKRITEELCRRAKVDGIEGFGYGKGYTLLAESVAGILKDLNTLQTKRGMHIVLLAHATIKRCDPPTEAGQPYDRHELKCTKQVSPLLKEWCDLLLFLNFRTLVQEGVSGKAKGIGGRERVMLTTHHAAYDAKNRFGLPDELPVDVASLVPVFAAPEAVKAEPKPDNLGTVLKAIADNNLNQRQVLIALKFDKAEGISDIPANVLDRMAKPDAIPRWVDLAKAVTL